MARDTYDAYRYCDGNRVFLNAKLEFLIAAGCHHTKYRLWLWRMLAFEMAILSPKEAFEYKWNIAVNLQGGVGNNIPNDNCVEIQVHNIKKILQAQGANKSYQSAVLACKTVQVVDKIKERLMKSSHTYRSSRRRPDVSKIVDITSMVNDIITAKVMDENCIYNWESFDTYRDPLQRINMQELHAWMLENKETLAGVFN